MGGTLISQLWGRGDESNSPIVYRKTPPDGASNVSVNTSVNALLNKVMNANTLNEETFTLKCDGSESSVDATVKMEGGNAILKPANPQ